MAQIARSRVALNWDQGGPGVNTFYWSAGVPSPLDWLNSASQFHEELHDVYTANAGILVSTVSWEIETTFDVIDVETGNIVDQPVLDEPAWTGVGTNTKSTVSRAQQAYFGFYTSRFEGGRRLRGGSYFGPLAAETIDASGRFSAADAVARAGYWDALISGPGPRLAVYHRPAVGSTAVGYYGDVTAVRLKREPAILRSRRD